MLGRCMNLTISGLNLTNLTSPTSAELRTWVTDETGTGVLVFANTPSLVTPAMTTPTITGGILNSVSNALVGWRLAVAPQALSGAGAINVTTHKTNWTTTGANAGTLANGAVVGQIKLIQLVVDGGDGTLTPVSLSGGTTITFADVGDRAELIWNGTAWVAINLDNIADGTTAPVLA